MSDNPIVPSGQPLAVGWQGYDSLMQNPAAVYLASLTSRQSRYTMTNALRTIVSISLRREVTHVSNEVMLAFPWHVLAYQHTASLRAQLAERYAPANANRIMSGLRGVLKEAWRLGYMTAEAYQRASDIKSIKASMLPKGRDLKSEELQLLVEACRRDPFASGTRDIAVFGLLYTCGLRRAELAALVISDYDADSGQLKIRAGKGRKQRIVYVAGMAKSALHRWLAIHPEKSGAMFVPVQKNGVYGKGGVTAQAVYNWLKRRGKEAGIRTFSPHDFRRTFVGDMLDQGVDIATVANIAGHSSVDTTRRYDRRPETVKKAAAEKLTFPGGDE